MSKCKITGKVLSIRLSREETQIALVGKNGEILYHIGLETPSGAVEDGVIHNYDAVRGMLRAALKTPELKHTRQAVFSLCTSQVITDTVTVPDLSEAKMEKLLMANVDMYFPVDMQDYHVVWQIVGTKPDSEQKEKLVQLWAVPKSMLVNYYTVANACGLSVAAVDYCGHSIATAVGAGFAKPAKAKQKQKIDRNKPIGAKSQPVEPDVSAEPQQAPETDLHITLERDLIGMTFVQNGQVVLQRLIQCGADPVYQVGEIAMMVEYFRSLDMGRGSYISGILSGSLAWNQRLNEELTDALGIVLTNFSGGYDPELILCVGAVRTDLDFGITTLNSPSKARSQVSNHLWQYALILVGGLALAGVILLTLSSRLVWNAEINSLQNTQQTLTIQAAQTNGFADNYNAYRSQYAAYSDDWETIFTSLKTYNDNLVLVLEELESIMPKSSEVTDITDGPSGQIPTVTGPVSITSLQIAVDGIQIQFACESKEEAAYLIMALRELKYADLVAISNLSGGGKGPATSYGSGESSVEAPPTEGSATGVDNSVVVQLVFSQLDKDAMVSLAKNMNKEQFVALENAYGKQPEITASKLDALKEENKETLTLQMRQDAIYDMLMNNPFAINRFSDLLSEDFQRPQPILWGYIMKDVVQLQREGKLELGTADNLVSVRNQMEVLINVLIKDEPTVGAVEQLLCTDETMEKTYIHYLEVQLGLREAELLPFLDVEKVFTDVLNGGFNTGDEALDESLNALISQDVWDLIDTITDEEKMSQLVDKFLEEGETGIDLADALINNYLEAGTTGYDMLDKIIEKFLDTESMNGKVTEMLTKYLTEGTTGSEKFDALIENYLQNGTTGNAEMDEAINDFIKNGSLDDLLSNMLNRYIADGTTGNTVIDGMLEKFLRTGSTGNTTIDGVIKDYLKTDKFMDKIEELLTKYLVEGATGNKLLDELIGNYMKDGKTGNPVLDELINDYIDEMLKELDDKKVGELVKKYLADKTTGNDLYDALLKKYFADGTTGIKKLDELIKKYQDSIIGGGSSDDILDLLDKFFGNGGSTGNAGQQASVDTRIFFTVYLTYSEDLIEAELVRKGLDYSEKIDGLEVVE